MKKFLAAMFATVFMLALLALAGTAQRAAPNSTCPEGLTCPPDYTCTIMMGYQGHCTNDGKHVEGYIDGCTYDAGTGKPNYVTIGASHTFKIIQYFHIPFYAKHISPDVGRAPRTTEFNNDKKESGQRVTFTMDRGPGPNLRQTRITRAYAFCKCTCNDHLIGAHNLFANEPAKEE